MRQAGTQIEPDTDEMGTQTVNKKNTVKEVEIQTIEVEPENRPPPPSLGGEELLFGNIISSGKKTDDERETEDEQNFERLLPGTDEFQSPVYLPDPP